MEPRKLVVLTAALLIAAAFTPLVVAQGPPDGDGPGRSDEARDNRTRGNGTGPAGTAGDGGPPDDPGAKGRARAAAMAQSMGRLAWDADNGTADGAFVSFSFDNATGTVSNWTYLDLAVLDELSFDAWNGSDPKVRGSNFMVDSSWDDSRWTKMHLHDNPTGFIKLGLNGSHGVHWTFADTIDVNQTSNWTVELTDDEAGFHAFLWKDRAANESGFDVDGQMVWLDVGNHSNVMFRVSPGLGDGPGLGPAPDGGYGPAGDGGYGYGYGAADDGGDGGPSAQAIQARERGRAIGMAAAQGQVGAEIALDNVGGTPASDVVAYDGIDVDPESGNGSVNVTLTFDGPAKTVVLRLGQGLIQAASVSDVLVLYDGEEIAEASSLADVLDPTDEDVPEALVVLGPAGPEVLVSVPHWSPHTVTVQQAGTTTTVQPPTTSALGLAAVVAGVLAAAGVVAHLSRRRRDGES